MAGGGRGTASLRARVTGRVQGVGFRWSAVREARRLGLRGRIRNAADGSVEVEADGAADAVAAFADWLRVGPPGAHVVGVDLAPAGAWDDDFDAEF